MWTHLGYPLWTDKTACLDNRRACVGEPVDEPYFDFWRDDRLLILKSIPGAHLNDLHRDLFASCGSIGVTPHQWKGEL